MGPGRSFDRFCPERVATLCSALFTRCRGGRLLSRDPVLPVLLVSSTATSPGYRILSDGTANSKYPRWAAVRLDIGSRAWFWAEQLAVALDSRGAAGYRLWTSDLSSTSRLPGRRVFSHRWGNSADPRRARGRGSRQA